VETGQHRHRKKRKQPKIEGSKKTTEKEENSHRGWMNIKERNRVKNNNQMSEIKGAETREKG